MTVYEFSVELVERVEADDDIERLYGTFDDGTIVTSGGRTRIDFDREASSLRGAIQSAITDVERCGLHVAQVRSEETEMIQEINSSLAGSATP